MFLDFLWYYITACFLSTAQYFITESQMLCCSGSCREVQGVRTNENTNSCQCLRKKSLALVFYAVLLKKVCNSSLFLFYVIINTVEPDILSKL